MAKVWDLATGEASHVLDGHDDVVSAVAMWPDGSKLVTGSYDGTAKVWDLASGHELLSLEQEEGSGRGDGGGSGDYGLPIYALAISPDGTAVMTADHGLGHDGEGPRVWQIQPAVCAFTSCMICPEGTYASAEASSSCTPCPAGSYSSTAGADDESSCIQCAAGSFSDADGASSCAVCPSGKTSDGGADMCRFECGAGSYHHSTAAGEQDVPSLPGRVVAYCTRAAACPVHACPCTKTALDPADSPRPIPHPSHPRLGPRLRQDHWRGGII